MQKAAIEAAAKAEAQELQGWRKDATAVLAALEGSYAEKMTEVLPIPLFSMSRFFLFSMKFFCSSLEQSKSRAGRRMPLLCWLLCRTAMQRR